LINNENYVTFEPYERFGSITNIRVIKEFKRKIRKNKQEPVYCRVQSEIHWKGGLNSTTCSGKRKNTPK
jgi:hypothetical protein